MNKTLKGTIRPKVALSGTISRTVEKTEPIIQALEVTENGTFSVSEGVHGFNPVNVAVPERYDEGFKDGYTHGYEIGYPEGYSASQKTIILQEKSVTENGEVTADYGFTALSKVNVNVPERKEEQEKTIEVTKNGSYEVIPEENKVLSKVNVEVDVAFDGEIGKPYIDTSKMTSFNDFFTYNTSALSEVDKLDTSNATSFNGMFRNCTTLLSVPPLNTSKGTNFNNMFYGCSNLQTVSQLDTSKGTKFANMFYRCTELRTIPPLDTSNGTDFSYMFYNCSKLETISITTAKSNFSTTDFYECRGLKNFTIGEGWAVNIYLHYSNKLTVESLHGMIENLADLTGTTAKTFQIGATNLAKIDEEHMTMLQNKNWNYS